MNPPDMAGKEPIDLEASFELFRRERVRRRVEQEARDASDQPGAVWKQLDEADNREVRSAELTREVHDFFAGATRTAAGIVQQLAESHERQSNSQLQAEVREFLEDVISRAENFMMEIQSRRQEGVQQAQIEARMANIVGPALDEFREAGTAQLGDKHLGQDPAAATPDDESPEDADGGDRSSTGSAGLKATLTDLVRSGAMSREAARAAWDAAQAEHGELRSSRSDD